MAARLDAMSLSTASAAEKELADMVSILRFLRSLQIAHDASSGTIIGATCPAAGPAHQQPARDGE
jgi:hypothetical protein